MKIVEMTEEEFWTKYPDLEKVAATEAVLGEQKGRYKTRAQVAMLRQDRHPGEICSLDLGTGLFDEQLFAVSKRLASSDPEITRAAVLEATGLDRSYVDLSADSQRTVAEYVAGRIAPLEEREAARQLAARQETFVGRLGLANERLGAGLREGVRTVGEKLGKAERAYGDFVWEAIGILDEATAPQRVIAGAVLESAAEATIGPRATRVIEGVASGALGVLDKFFVISKQVRGVGLPKDDAGPRLWDGK